MEIRNIQKTGGSSFSLTLPKDWIKMHALRDKGKVIIYAQKSGSLILLPYQFKQQKSWVSINVYHLTESWLEREIIANYVAGLDEIVLKAERFSEEQIRIIRKTVTNLIGLEVLEQTLNKVVIKNIFDTAKFSVLENINKMFFIVINMHNDVFQAMEQRNKNLALNIIERDKDVDKLYLAINRLLYSLLQNKITEEEINLDLTDLHYYAKVACNLERIADHTVKIAKMIILQSKKSQELFTRTLRRTTKKTSTYLQQIEKVLNLADKNKAHEIVDLQRYLSKNAPINKNIIKKSSIEVIIEDSLNRIRGYIENIAEEAIDYFTIKHG